MQRIKTSETNKVVVQTLSGKGKYNFKDNRTIGQIAFAYSVQLNKIFDLEIDYPLKDNKGFEYPDSLLGELFHMSNDLVYKAVLNHHYGKNLSQDEFTKLVKLHIDHGLEIFQKDILDNSKGKNAHIDYLLKLIKNGLSVMSNATSIYSTKIERDEASYNGLIEVTIGTDTKSGEVVKLRINDENQFDSQHFAVAGMNGSGKTELVKDILNQITQQTKHELKFIFFDYKGEGQSDKLKTFLSATKAEFIDIQSIPLSFNPLINISFTNERERVRSIKTFRDKLGAIDKRIGVKQKNSLELAIQRAFENESKSGSHPTIVSVYEELLAYYEESKMKPDTMTAIMKDLSDVVFSSEYDKNFKLIDRSLYVNLPTSLPESARKASVFLMLNYILNHFIDCTNVVPDENRIKPIRYIIVIDEAHAYLKEKNMAAVLEELLRMIRSKGVIVMMLSQGVEEYKQKDFDFSSQIKIPIFLNVQNKELKVAKSFLGTPKSESKLTQCLQNLESGKGVINFDDTKLIDIRQFWRDGKYQTKE